MGNAQRKIKMRQHQQYLLDICRYKAGTIALDEVQSLASGSDRELTLQEAIRLKMMPLLSDFATKHRADPWNADQMHAFSNAITANQKRTNEYIQITKDIQKGLNDAGIPTIARKGVIYQTMLYPGAYCRRFSDLDMYANQKQQDELERFFKDNGWITGSTADPAGEKLYKTSREMSLMFKLYPDHLEPRVKELNLPQTRFAQIDVSFDLAWINSTASPKRHDVLAGLLETPVMDPVTGIATLPKTFHFIDVVMHVYRDLYFENVAERDFIVLTKLLDCVMLFKSLTADDQAEIIRISRALNIEGELVRVASHSQSFFGIWTYPEAEDGLKKYYVDDELNDVSGQESALPQKIFA